jgi:hypothetical protein
MTTTMLWQVICDLATREYEVLGQADGDEELITRCEFINSRLAQEGRHMRAHSPLVSQTSLEDVRREMHVSGLRERPGLLVRRLAEAGWVRSA